jgi:hypothetical protein
MSLSAFIGYAKAPDGRESGAQAALQALDQVGRSPLIFGILIVHTTLTKLLGEQVHIRRYPLIGFSLSRDHFQGVNRACSDSLNPGTMSPFKRILAWVWRRQPWNKLENDPGAAASPIEWHLVCHC